MGRIANLLESTHDQQRSSQKSSDESNPDERIVQTAPSCDATGHPRGSIISSPTNLLSSRDSGVDMIEQGLLSIKQAETLFTSYQKMAPNFPYVVIHPDTTVTQLRRDSPMLLNAMFLTGAYSDRGLHHLLQEQYLKLLSSKSMIAGEASMDLLQSVLIYLAWFVAFRILFLRLVYRLSYLQDASSCETESKACISNSVSRSFDHFGPWDKSATGEK